MQIENVTKLLSCLYSYFLTLSVSQLVFFVKIKKQFSLRRKVNLKTEEFNCEKAGFRAIHMENDADMLISWRRITNGATEYSTR